MVALVPGQSFAGEFTIERALSEGGMGVVYVALQRSTGKRRALKVMQPALVSAKDPAQARRNRERFLAEARAGSGVQSEHVVEVLGAGVDPPTGSPWLVMELLDGRDLDAEIEARGRLPAQEVYALFEQLCHAVGAAHRAGVCHLDLKPENVFLARSHNARGGQTVKVLDFGIARLVSEHQRSAPVTTALGSPLWMSPEQATQGARVGPYSDVWALGLIAFRLLTGRHYWRAANVPSEQFNLTAWVMEMMTSDLSAASARAGDLGVAQHVPTPFDAWFARCVTRDTGARFADADDALRDLGAALEQPSQEHTPAGFAQTQPVAAPIAPTKAWTPEALASPPLSNSNKTIKFQMVTLPPAGLLLLAMAAAGWVVSSRKRPRAPAPDAPVAAVVVRSPLACPADMALIPAGTFLMGSPQGQGARDERPQHDVRLEGFCIDRTEVTVAAYRQCVAAGQCATPNPFIDAPRSEDSLCNWGRPDVEGHPVNCVDWAQSRRFCEWSGHADGSRRLPREAEWEYAARGTLNRPYPWGSFAPDGALANACGEECAEVMRTHGFNGWTGMPSWRDAHGATAPVTEFSAGATPEGVLNLAGNVAEWIEDPYDAEAYQHHDAQGSLNARPSQPPIELHAHRGGSWATYDRADLRSMSRRGAPSSLRTRWLGIRCARSAMTAPD